MEPESTDTQDSASNVSSQNSEAGQSSQVDSDGIPWKELKECCRDYKAPRASKELRIKFGFTIPRKRRTSHEIGSAVQKVLNFGWKNNLKRSQASSTEAPLSKKAKLDLVSLKLSCGKKQNKITQFLMGRSQKAPGDKNDLGFSMSSKNIRRCVKRAMDGMLNTVCDDVPAMSEKQCHSKHDKTSKVKKSGKKVSSIENSKTVTVKPKKKNEKLVKSIVSDLVNAAYRQAQRSQVQVKKLNFLSSSNKNEVVKSGKPKKMSGKAPNKTKENDKLVKSIVLDLVNKSCAKSKSKQVPEKQTKSNKENAKSINKVEPKIATNDQGVWLSQRALKNVDNVVNTLLNSMLKKVSQDSEKENAKKKKMAEKAQAVKAKAERKRILQQEFLIKAAKGSSNDTKKLNSQNLIRLLSGQGSKSASVNRQKALKVVPAPQSQAMCKSPDLLPFQKLLTPTAPEQPALASAPGCSHTPAPVSSHSKMSNETAALAQQPVMLVTLPDLNTTQVIPVKFFHK